MKKILLSTIFLCTIVLDNLCAQEVTLLVAHLRDNSSTQFLLSNQPKITFEASSLIISSTSLTKKYSFNEMRSLTFSNSNDPNSIKEVKTEIPFIQNGENLLFQGLPVGTAVNIYTINGALIKSVVSDSDNGTSISLQSVSRGVYLVEIKNITYKLIKQ